MSAFQLFIKNPKTSLFKIMGVALGIALLKPQIDSKIQLYYTETKLNNFFLDNLPSLTKGRYFPTFWLGYGNLQAIYGYFEEGFYQMADLEFVREKFTVNNNIEMSVDWAQLKGKHTNASTLEDTNKKNTILLIVPGLTACPKTYYIKELTREALIRGYDKVVIINHRWTTNQTLSLEKSGKSDFYNDFYSAIDYVCSKYNNQTIHAIGCSLGANALVNYLGLKNQNNQIKAAVSVGNPFDVKITVSMLTGTFWDFYITKFAKDSFLKFKPEIEKFSSYFDIDIKKVETTNTMRQFDELLTRRLYKYRTVEEFYKDKSCKVNIPLLCLSCTDDPVIHHYAIPYDECKSNPNVLLAVTKAGGHVGWFEGFIPKRWYPKPAFEFLEANLKKDTQTTPF